MTTRPRPMVSCYRGSLCVALPAVWLAGFVLSSAAGAEPVSQGKDGRDHNPQGFFAWLAGAGIQGGASFGETDEIGYKAAVDPTTCMPPCCTSSDSTTSGLPTSTTAANSA